jgi:hypothetical protein
MKGKAVGFMLCSVVLTSFASGASANGGVISFKGQMVSTACEVRPLSDARSLEDTQQVQVSAHITLAVNTYRNACSDDLIPFSATYTALPASPAEGVAVDRSSDSGVVTLTYQ